MPPTHESRVAFLLALCASCTIHAAVDSVLHQLILSFMLLLSRESITFRVRVFLTGIIVACFAFSRLYGSWFLKVSYAAEKRLLARSGILIAFLTVLFAFTTEEYVPLFAALMSLALFMVLNARIRLSIRNIMEASE